MRRPQAEAQPTLTARAYLDDAGAAPVLRQAMEARAVAPTGNPASPHLEGRLARAALDGARDAAAAALGVASGEVVFCASGTEAVNLALLGAGRRLGAGRATRFLVRPINNPRSS